MRRTALPRCRVLIVAMHVNENESMKSELLMIGTELLLGQIHDTNSTYMSQVLAEQGIPLYQKVTVGDNLERIVAALDDALNRSDVVLCSGGLGPTEDDITREAIAALLGRKLVFRQDLYDDMVQRFSHYRMQITENNKRQTTLPEGAIPLKNPHGTAPGLIVECERGIIACMPGVPSELYPMLEERVVPYIRQRYNLSGTVQSRILKVCGLGESRVDSIIGDLIQGSSNPTVGLLASPRAVTIRITAFAADQPAAQALIAPMEKQIRERLDGLIMGVDDDTLESVVDRLLRDRGWTIAVLETQTGGMLSHLMSHTGMTSYLGSLVQNPVLDGAAVNTFDLKARILLHYPADCVLVMQTDMPNRTNTVHFFMPEKHDTYNETPDSQIFSWQQGFASLSEKDQLRSAVGTLERIRRILTTGKVEV